MQHEARPSVRAPERLRIHRRTLTRSVAWTLPVASVAVGAPAFAGSGGGPVSGGFSSACKYPGGSAGIDCHKAYQLAFAFTNTTGSDVTVTVSNVVESITKNGNELSTTLVFASPSVVTVPAGGTGSFLVVATGSRDTGNVSAILTATYSCAVYSTSYAHPITYSYTKSSPCGGACPISP